MNIRFVKKKELLSLLLAVTIMVCAASINNLPFKLKNSSNSFRRDFKIPKSSNPDSFISVWNTSAISTGSTDDKTISLPLISAGNYDFWIDWGDGTPMVHYTTYDVATHTHKYTSAGIYGINITGTIQGWQFNNGGDRLKLLGVLQWGNLQVGNDGGYFFGCSNLEITATDKLDLSLTSDMSSAFRECNNLGSNAAINEWDVSSVTNMNSIFYSADSFNCTIEKWDVSQVTSMVNMFRFTDFNKYIGGWDVSNVIDMRYMFADSSFNQSINSWNVSNVTDMDHMFYGASSFNQPLNNWDVSNVTDMDYMFYGASSFNQSLNNWDVSNVTDMHYMFAYADSFNGDISNWVVSNVTYMYYMFFAAHSFNQPLNSWDVSNVISMWCMFTDAQSFNQPLNNWDVSSVTDMAHMFSVASSFNQDLDNWDVSNIDDMTNMFYEAKDFDGDISTWDVSKVTVMQRMFSGASSFNQPINNWIVTNVTDMSYMFWGASSFDQPLNNWDVSNVTDMSYMFFNASSFDQPLNNWDTANVTNMAHIFDEASSFNQPLNNWDVSSVTNMYSMFRLAIAFNQDISAWDVSSVTTMRTMFLGASSFNQPLNNWDVSNVNNMGLMFQLATSFNQPINNWDVSSVTDMYNMFLGVTLDSEIYDDLLIAWSLLPLQTSVNFHAGFSRYTSLGVSARTSIIASYSWSINDMGQHYLPFASELSSDADSPDDDGSYTLSWAETYITSNYTVYQYSSPITEINGSLMVLESETGSLSLMLNDVTNGTYYYAVSSNNEYGSVLSNSIQVDVLTYLYITITNPTSSSSWDLDTAQTMTWESEGDITNVRIELYRGDAFVMEIISSTPNDGEFVWLVPSTLSYADNYRIKIIDVLNPDTYDYSEYFEIGTPPDEPKKVPGYGLLTLIAIASVISIILVVKTRKSTK